LGDCPTVDRWIQAGSFQRLRHDEDAAIFFDQLRLAHDTASMSERTRKITVNVPVRVLENAVKITGKGVTPTVIEGLEELDRRAKRSALRALRGKIRFEQDLEDTRR
jgi:hypothetical protein